MALEKVTLVDGKEVEIQCSFLLPRRAFSLLKNLMKITEMTPVTLETTNEKGEKVFEKSNKLVGDFAGIIELMPLAIDEIVQECPQKNQLSIESMKNLYSKYAEKTISEAMASVSPKW